MKTNIVLLLLADSLLYKVLRFPLRALVFNLRSAPACDQKLLCIDRHFFSSGSSSFLINEGKNRSLAPARSAAASIAKFPYSPCAGVKSGDTCAKFTKLLLPSR